MGAKKSTSQTASGPTWLVRAGVAIALGLVLGAAGGVVGVNRMEPGRPGQPDSLQLMLDSLRQQAVNDPIQIRRAADSASAAERMQRVADSTTLANDPNAPVVPDVVGMEEGAARDAIELAGLAVGDIQFRAAKTNAGVVLAAFPAPKLKVRPGTAVNLILSDGRTPDDTLNVTASFFAQHLP